MFQISPLVEFYITNVCNLTCRGCNRFNNYKFKGHQYWADHAPAYEEWSRRVSIPDIHIIGGEPTLNPDLETWVQNLRRLWPTANIMVQTNGTYHKPEFHQWWDKYQVGFAVSVHDMSLLDELKETWKYSGYYIKADVFHQATVIQNQNDFTVHSSNVTNAFNACDMKHDHTMYNGKLYKCPAMCNLPDFDQQFNLKLDDRQRELLYSYMPLAHTCSDEEIQDFIDSKNKSIPQCEFCPQNIAWHTALGELKTNLPKPVYCPIEQYID